MKPISKTLLLCLVVATTVLAFIARDWWAFGFMTLAGAGLGLAVKFVGRRVEV